MFKLTFFLILLSTECSGKDNWMCLQCGSVRCGRYEQGHALKHSSQRNHSICINTVNLSVYW